MISTYLNLDFDGVIYPRFPQSVKAVIAWFCSREDIIEGLVGMSGDKASKEEIKEAFKQVAPIIIQHDPRKLYEFFDDQGIKICIGVHPDSDSMFVYYNSVKKESFTASIRSEAERLAFVDAFNILEGRLRDAQTEGSIG